MSHLTKEQKEFIINLSNEMKTQDNRITRSPYAFLLREEIEHALPDDSDNGELAAYCHSGACVYENWEEFVEYISENSEGASDEYKEKVAEAIELGDFEDFKLNELDSFFELSIYRREFKQDISENNFNLFLTEKGYQAHVKINKHHLNKPDSYVTYLGRNEEMENLYGVIHALAMDLQEAKDLITENEVAA